MHACRKVHHNITSLEDRLPVIKRREILDCVVGKLVEINLSTTHTHDLDALL
jgi:hypothetical protein